MSNTRAVRDEHWKEGANKTDREIHKTQTCLDVERVEGDKANT